MDTIRYFLMVITFLIGSTQYGNHSIAIVTLQENEWHMYRDIRLRAVKEIPHAFGSTYKEELQMPEHEWKRRLKLNMFFAVDGNNKVVGMIGAAVDPRQKVKHTAFIISFYVVPESRNQGIGLRLLDHLVSNLAQKNIKNLYLKVTVDQQAAIKLYKKFGFYITGVSENEYLINNTYYDQYIMTKHINT